MSIKNSFRTNNSRMHDRIIKSVVVHLQNDGYSVKAKNINHPNGCPKNFKGFTPDIHATKNNKKIIIEVETPNSIHSPDLKKWKRFSSYSGTEFWVIVPSNCLERAKQKKDMFHIPLSIYCSNGNGKLDFVI